MNAERPEFSGRILIADDNRAMAQVVRFNLERSGFDVAVARTGLEAWTLAQHQEFDLVVTDYQMPDMNGEELCRHLRGHDRYQVTPLILLSAKGLELDSRRLQEELGFAAIMFKPFSPRSLVETVAAALQMAGSRL